MTGCGDGSGISWTICKQSAPRSRQITTPTPHHSIFRDWMLFMMPNQQLKVVVVAVLTVVEIRINVNFSNTTKNTK